jgi:hypothetical protein
MEKKKNQILTAAEIKKIHDDEQRQAAITNGEGTFEDLDDQRWAKFKAANKTGKVEALPDERERE